MIPLLSGILGQVKVLTGRLSAARAGYLDNLNTNLAVAPAPASTALSTATWTSGLATRLAGAGISQAQEYTTGSGNWSVPANVTLCWTTMIAAGGAGGKDAGGGAGGGSGEMLFRMPYKCTAGGTVAYAIGAGVTATNGANTTFGTLTVEGGKKGTTTKGNGGGALGATGTGAAAVGTAIGPRIGGSAGGAGGPGVNGGASASFGGGVSTANCGGGGSSFFAVGGTAVEATTPSKPGVGAGAGGTVTGAASAAGGDGYMLIEWIG